MEMESVTSLLLIAVIAFLLGGGAVYLMRGCNRDKEKELQDELDNLRAAFEAYRQDVGRHFSRTSELVDRMTESYRAVYDHLSDGTQKLVYDRRFDEQGRVIFNQEQRPSFPKTQRPDQTGAAPAMDYAPREKGDTRASIFDPESFKETDAARDYAPREKGDTRASIFRPESFKEDDETKPS
jgi:uncharacterized membrane-anchored protein YhcB (DUF1043 family)